MEPFPVRISGELTPDIQNAIDAEEDLDLTGGAISSSGAGHRTVVVNAESHADAVARVRMVLRGFPIEVEPDDEEDVPDAEEP